MITGSGSLSPVGRCGAGSRPKSLFWAALSPAFKYAIAGKKFESLRSLDLSSQLLKTKDFQYAYWIAECLALIDEKEEARG
jgi:hypothetical protein